MPPPSEPALETTAPRQAPPPPLAASIDRLLQLHDRGLVDAPTTRLALRQLRRGATLAEVLEAAGVPRSLRDKAEDLLRPTATRLDRAAALALSLVPPAVAALAGEATRLRGLDAGVALALAGGAAVLLVGSRPVKAGGAAIATAALLSLAADALPTSAVVVVPAATAAVSAFAFTLRPVSARVRSGVGGVLAGAAVEALRALVPR